MPTTEEIPINDDIPIPQEIPILGIDRIATTMYGHPARSTRETIRTIRVIGISESSFVPTAVNQALLGLKVKTRFRLGETMLDIDADPNMLLAYVSDVIEALREAGEEDTARFFKSSCFNSTDLFGFTLDLCSLLDDPVAH